MRLITTVIAASFAVLAAFSDASARAEPDARFGESTEAVEPSQVADRYGLAQHAISMHGAPALGPDFTHLPYANPSAPQGGRAVFGKSGAFDSLNPYIVRGRSVWELRELVFESLMARSWDEPFTLYGLLAQTIATPDDRSSVTFMLRPEARFSTGAPVTIDDVVWSMETLRDHGTPNFRNMYGQVARIERLGERGVRFHFERPNRELPLLMGLMPVLSKAAWEGRDFARGGLDTPVGSGPYQVAEMEAGRRIVFRKNPDYWGRDLPVNQGRRNLDEIEFTYFRDGGALWEAFTAGRIDFHLESDLARWEEGYDFPAARDGRVQREEIPHKLPSGLDGFVFNTRRAPFDDRRVREALALAFDFEWMNARFHRGALTRIEGYFSGSELGFEDPIEAGASALLVPFAADGRAPLEPGWRPPTGAGDGRNRANLRRARTLLSEAGWRIQDGALRNEAGDPFLFEILVQSNADERVSRVFADMLAPLGVAVDIRLVDGGQYQERLNAFDYDMIIRRWFASLSPGEEQRQYWGSTLADTPGSRNYMGVKDPAIDAMIDAMLAATTREELRSAARALDRVLANGVYVIPLGYSTVRRVAWRTGFDRPATPPIYGYRRDLWWRVP